MTLKAPELVAPLVGCTHLRQRHPRRAGLLPCAWPACPAGVADTSLELPGRPPETEERLPLELPLTIQRRLLVLEEGERLFIWHPTTPSAGSSSH